SAAARCAPRAAHASHRRRAGARRGRHGARVQSRSRDLAGDVSGRGQVRRRVRARADPAMTTPIDVAVLGGGISGLTAAFTLGVRRPELDVRVLEAGPRLGGCIRTDRTDGFVIEAGPDSFLRTKPEALELCRELGLEGELIGTRPEAHTVF